MDKRNDLGINLIGYATGYSAGESGGGGGGGNNTAVSYTGSATNVFWTINWQPLVIPDTMTYAGGIFYNYKMGHTPRLLFHNNVTNVENLYYSSNETIMDMSGWDITNINSFYYTFAGSKLLEIVFPTTHCTASNVNVKSMFYQVNTIHELDLKDLYIDNMKNADYMFYGCSNMTSVDMRNIKSTTNPTLTYMFYNCMNLTHADVRGIDFTTAGTGSMLKNVPTTCEFVVKDETNKTWWNTNFPTYTNVKTAEEYDNQ